MKRFCITLLTLLFIILASLSFVGCADAKSPPPVVDDPDLLKEILNIKFDVMDKFSPSGHIYLDLFEKRNEADDSQIFLTEYGESDGYYLVYMRMDQSGRYSLFLNNYHNAIAEHEASGPSGPRIPDYFTKFSQYDIVDGKYVYAFQQVGGDVDKFMLCKVDNIEEATLYHSLTYRLVMCVEAKKVIVRENLSTNEVINHPVTIFRRASLQIRGGKVEKYIYPDAYVRVSENTSEEYFDYEGLLIECASPAYATMTATSMPYRGFEKTYEEGLRSRFSNAAVLEEGESRYVVMLRYLYDGYGAVKKDFIDEGLFGDNRKEALLDAFVTTYEVDEGVAPLEGSASQSGYIYGKFDYEKICDLISQRG